VRPVQAGAGSGRAAEPARGRLRGRHVLRALPVLALALLGTLVAHAQSYPAHLVRIVVPYPPGGGNDLIARFVAPKLAERLGQPFVVDNRPGAAGNLGADLVAHAPADGYTLLVATSTIAMSPGLGRMSYDVLHDLAPVVYAASTPMVIGVHPDVPARSLRELIELGRHAPGKFAYSSCGTASPMHLAGEMLNLATGAGLVHVPYKGCANALSDVVGGTVPVAFTTLSLALPQEKAGRIRLLAIASSTRSPDAPELPTVAEQGVKGYEADIWFGFFATAGTPPATLSLLNAEINRALAAPDVGARLRAQNYAVRGGTADSFGEFVRAEFAKWTRLIREARIQSD